MSERLHAARIGKVMVGENGTGHTMASTAGARQRPVRERKRGQIDGKEGSAPNADISYDYGEEAYGAGLNRKAPGCTRVICPSLVKGMLAIFPAPHFPDLFSHHRCAGYSGICGLNLTSRQETAAKLTQNLLLPVRWQLASLCNVHSPSNAAPLRRQGQGKHACARSRSLRCSTSTFYDTIHCTSACGQGGKVREARHC
jgi:hypothetical protein